MEKVRFALLRNDAIPPVRKNPTDAGIDFFTPYNVLLEPGDVRIVKTGVTVEIPEGFMMLLKPKSKNNHLVGAGVIDAYYHPGEILIKIFNPTKNTIILKRGDGIAQGVFIPVATPELIEDISILEDVKSPRSGKGGIVEQQLPLL